MIFILLLLIHPSIFHPFIFPLSILPPRCQLGPQPLRTHHLVPTDGHPGAGLAASAGEGTVAWLALMVPIAAPLGEVGLESGAGGMGCAQLCSGAHT